MSQVERKQLVGTICLEGRDYRFQAVVFRRAHYGAIGRIGATLWQFGAYSELRVNPAVPDHLIATLQQEIAQRANRDEPLTEDGLSDGH